MATNFDSATTAGGDDALADQYNDLRKDVLRNAGDYETTTGSSDAYVLSVDAQISALTEGDKFRIKANFTNSGPSTINVNATGAVNIKVQTDAGKVDVAPDQIKNTQIYELTYDGTDMVLSSGGVSANLTAEFGGDGSDGALSVSSGTTNIDLGGAKVVIKNYTSISITGTGQVTFSNPHANGTFIILRSQGDVTITSSTTPCIDASGMGAQGGQGGQGPGDNNGNDGNNPSTFAMDLAADHDGQGGQDTTGGTAGQQLDNRYLYTVEAAHLSRKHIVISPGAGGGGGASSSDSDASEHGGDGGDGGAALLIECGGAWNFTTANGISVAGTNGGDGDDVTDSSNVNGCGAGGGGSAGMFIALYRTLTADTGTVDTSGGDGGDGGSATSTGGGSSTEAGGAGGGGAGAYGGAGGAGGDLDNNGSNGNGTGSGGGGGGGGTVPGGGGPDPGGTGGSGAGNQSTSFTAENTFF